MTLPNIGPRAPLSRSSAAQLLARLASQNQPITHELLDCLPVNQDVHYVRGILVHTEVLPDFPHVCRGISR